MRLLDLFCGAGGAAMGYHQAGFTDIVGVDIVPQSNYPFTFIQGDALEPPVRLEDFDLIHASPPCQRFSTHTPKENKHLHPDFVAATRELLGGKPHVIENVRAAGLAGQIMLCGSMFGMQIQRHRYFETYDLPLMFGQACDHSKWEMDSPYTVTGNADGSAYDRRDSGKYIGFRDTAHARDLMEMLWAKTTREVTEAIPPAYTKYIGEQFLAQQ